MINFKSGRHALAVTLLVFLAIAGALNLAAYSQSATNTIKALPGPLGRIYYAVLAVGALVALVGVFRPGLGGPRLEQSGLWILAGLFSGYAAIAVALAQWRALFFALVLLGLAVGCVMRIRQSRREVKKVIAAAVQTGATDQLE